MKDLYKMNLQLFADGEETPEEPEETNEETKDVLTMTQEELDKLLQQEGDKRVSSARKKFEQDFKSKLEKEKEEAERLAKLTAEERKQEELKLALQEAEELKSTLRRERLERDAIDILVQENIPTDFVDYLIREDEETTKDAISTFKEQWNKAIDERVKAEIDGKLAGETPKKTASVVGDTGIDSIKDLANQLNIRK